MPTKAVITEQDWDKVVFSKRNPHAEAETIEKRKVAQQAARSREAEDLPQKKVSVAQTQSLAQLRTSAGFKTQKALAAATKGKIPATRINELESGRGNVPTGTEKQILFKLVKMKY